MLGGSEICGNKVFKHQNLLWKDHTTTGDVWKQQVEKRDSSTFQNTKEMDKSSAGFELLGHHKKSKSGEMNKLTILVRCHKFPLTFEVILHIGRSENISYPQIHWGSPSRSH
jgi:hypothetical protein